MPLDAPAVNGSVPLSADEAAALAAAFKALGDPVRLRLVSLIAAHENGEACVCDLTGAFELSGPTISHHLKVLRTAGLITGERRGTWIYYRIVTDLISHLADVLDPTTTPLASRCTPEESDRPE